MNRIVSVAMFQLVIMHHRCIILGDEVKARRRRRRRMGSVSVLGYLKTGGYNLGAMTNLSES